MFPIRAYGLHFPRSALQRIFVFLIILISAGPVYRENDTLVASQAEYKGRRIAQVMGAAGAD